MLIVRRRTLLLSVFTATQLVACSDAPVQPNTARRLAPVTRSAVVVPSANLIQNGSFEATTSPHFPGWSTFCQGSQALTGWQISGTDCVDVHWGEQGTHWTNIPDGQQALDLNGSGVGAVLSQAVAGTVHGRQYTLAFYVSDNPACAPPTVSAELSFGGQVVADVTRHTANSPLQNMTWDFHQFTVTAPSDNAVLAFKSLTQTGCGFAIDDVRLGPADVTAPDITPNITGTLGSNGWYTSDVTVGWSVTDGESVITSAPCGSTSITADTQSAVASCSATSDGGTANTSVTIMRDATKPSVSFSQASGAYTVDQTVTIGCTASDAMSGLAASSTCPSVNAPAYTFALGNNTLTANVQDNAGNTNSASSVFSVSVTQASLCAVVQSVVSNAGVANSLCTKLKQKSSTAFVNEVAAQSGKLVPADKAPVLTALGKALLDH